MPIARISLVRGRSAAHRRAIADGVYRAMRETFGVPDKDRFALIHEHDAENFIFDDGYLDIARTDSLVMIQITCSDTRSTVEKQALYAAIVDNLAADPGLRREDVLINLVEVKTEDWSFGFGIGQYIKG